MRRLSSGALTSATLTGARLAHRRRSDLAASSRLSPSNARSTRLEDENRIAPASPPSRRGGASPSPSAASPSPSPMGSSCQTTSREAVKSATRSAKKRWLGRHGSPGRRRLRAAAAPAEAAEDAPGPAASACAPRRHIGMQPRGGGDRSGAAKARVRSCSLLVTSCCHMGVGRVPMRAAGAVRSSLSAGAGEEGRSEEAGRDRAKQSNRRGAEGDSRWMNPWTSVASEPELEYRSSNDTSPQL